MQLEIADGPDGNHICHIQDHYEGKIDLTVERMTIKSRRNPRQGPDYVEIFISFQVL